MNRWIHKIYVSTFILIIALTTVLLSIKGYSYYDTGLEERFYHPDHNLLKPSGFLGHGLGIIGTFLIITGVFSYVIRKRSRNLSRIGRLKYWLEFHIFLCVLGPILILFHTAFKFGGIVSVSFWSMAIVVASGIIGRFIYIQIPRTIEGREMSLGEVKELRNNINEILREEYKLEPEKLDTILRSGNSNASDNIRTKKTGAFSMLFKDRQKVKKVRKVLRGTNLSKLEIRKVTRLIKNEISLNHKIGRLQMMQRLFKYWHVAHLPFAMIMLIILVIHVAVTIAFGARWIF